MREVNEGSSAELNTWRSVPCKLWSNSTDSDGYGKAYYQGELISTHRREYIIHHGAIPFGLEVMHLCDIKPCYEIKHLKLGTKSENMMHAGIRGDLSRNVIGEKNPNSRLTSDDVREIRRLSQEDILSRSALSTKFRVTETMIGRIVRRKAWAHVK